MLADKLWLVVVVVLTSAAVLHAATAANSSVLVLLESDEQRTTHSVFLDQLRLAANGQDVVVKLVDDADIRLAHYDRYLHSAIILLGSSVQTFGSRLKVADFVNFVDKSGGHIVVVATSGRPVGRLIRELASEVGVEFDDAERIVIDHFNYDPKRDDGSHTTVNSVHLDAAMARLFDRPSVGVRLDGSGGSGDAKSWTQQSDALPILYRGVAMRLPPVTQGTAHASIAIATGQATAHSYKQHKRLPSRPRLVGHDAVLVGAVQTQNDARITFIGSTDMLSNAFLSAESDGYANAALVRALTRWSLGIVGVLRVVATNHHLANKDDSDGVKQLEPPAAGTYTIKEDVVYTIDVEEMTCPPLAALSTAVAGCEWQPYVSPHREPMQLEFVRMDPFVRLTLRPDASRPGRHVGSFRIPDVYGIYQFVVDHAPRGMTRIRAVTQYPVRPLRHDQYERFIVAAYPYYASAFSMMAGLWLFSVVFLHFKD